MDYIGPQGEMPVTVEYTNWRGETAVRTILPLGVWWGSTRWHPEPQWFLSATDLEKGAVRDFAWRDMKLLPEKGLT